MVGFHNNGPHRVRLWVRDHGMGIAPDKINRLFQPFDRLGVESANIEGTGIGLTLCKALTELMGGTIGVESTLGEGSTFWIELPSVESAELGVEMVTSESLA